MAVEATPKKFKRLQVIGLILFFLGAFVVYFEGGLGGWGMLPLGLGGALYLAGKWSAWWNHG